MGLPLDVPSVVTVTWGHRSGQRLLRWEGSGHRIVLRNRLNDVEPAAFDLPHGISPAQPLDIAVQAEESAGPPVVVISVGEWIEST